MPAKPVAEKFWWKVMTATVASLVVVWAVRWWSSQPSQVAINQTVCSFRTLADRVGAADVILTGQVFAVIPSGPGAEVIISPLRLYRGTLPVRGIQIVARPMKPPARLARSGQPELTFASDQPPYLLFLQSRADGKFDTSACAGSRTLGSGLTPEEVQLLGAGQPVE